MAETILAKLAVEISAKATQFGKVLSDQEKALKGFSSGVQNASNQLKGILGTIGVAFSAGAVANFTLEVAKLAGEAEGVRAAFDRLPNSIQLMGELKTATAGTVSELELMKRTVQASNFGIGLESLPKLLEFAAVRAQQTGQSVDYLVDSIVTGIGRKSPLILDNLGISAVRLKEQFGGAALEAQSIGDVAKAVGKIAEEELTKMGDLSENTATKIARLGASWEDLKVAIGEAANSSGAIQKTLNMLTNFANSLAGDELTTGINQLQSNVSHTSEILERFAAAGGKIDLSWQEIMARGFAGNEAGARKLEERLAGIALAQKNIAIATKAIATEVDPLTGLGNDGIIWKPAVVVEQVKTLTSLQEKVNELNEQFKTTDINDEKKLKNIGQEIVGITAQIDAINKLKQARKQESELSAFGKEQLKNAKQGIQTELPEQKDSADIEAFPVPEITDEQVDAYMAQLKRITDAQVAAGITAVNAQGEVIDSQDRQIDKQAEQEAKAKEFGTTFGNIIGAAIKGEESFADSMKRITKELLKQFLIQALGAAISKSFQTAKNPIIGAALAAAMTGIVSAMFSKIGGGGGKSVGGGGGSAGGSESNRVTREKIDNRQQIELGGKFVVAGKDMQVVLSNQNVRSQRTG